MVRHIKIILVVCGIVIISLLVYIHLNWAILPTESSPQTLTLVKHGDPSINKIIIKHYINESLVNGYVLDLKEGLRNIQPQKYRLPNLDEGRAEINIESEDGVITVNYNQVRDLYDKGLLIYLTTDYMSYVDIDNVLYTDQYVYFISGKEKICYFEKAGLSEWTIVQPAQHLSKLARKERMSYITADYNWKEKNRWVMLSDN